MGRAADLACGTALQKAGLTGHCSRLGRQCPKGAGRARPRETTCLARHAGLCGPPCQLCRPTVPAHLALLNFTFYSLLFITCKMSILPLSITI